MGAQQAQHGGTAGTAGSGWVCSLERVKNRRVRQKLSCSVGIMKTAGARGWQQALTTQRGGGGGTQASPRRALTEGDDAPQGQHHLVSVVAHFEQLRSHQDLQQGKALHGSSTRGWQSALARDRIKRGCGPLPTVAYHPESAVRGEGGGTKGVLRDTEGRVCLWVRACEEGQSLRLRRRRVAPAHLALELPHARHELGKAAVEHAKPAVGEEKEAREGGPRWADGWAQRRRVAGGGGHRRAYAAANWPELLSVIAVLAPCSSAVVQPAVRGRWQGRWRRARQHLGCSPRAPRGNLLISSQSKRTEPE